MSILLHRLRPFILHNEPASFNRVSAIIGKCITDPRFRALLRQQRELYDGRDFQRQLTISCDKEIVNCDGVLFDWLNSYEYHRDLQKRQATDSLFERLPSDLLRGILVNLVVDKMNAIGKLRCLIAVLLGRMKELRFEAAPPFILTTP